MHSHSRKTFKVNKCIRKFVHGLASIVLTLTYEEADDDGGWQIEPKDCHAGLIWTIPGQQCQHQYRWSLMSASSSACQNKLTSR